MNIRLILDAAAPGDWNMAVDEALLEGAVAAKLPTLRFYGWSEPTVSLGYFQPLAARIEHEASQMCSVVRRSTGGGAIVHDRELTYSFVLPHGAAGFSQYTGGSLPLYQLFHRSLIRVLTGMGLAAEWCVPTVGKHRSEEPFLCFQRRAEGDVIAGAHKLAGSAQRRQGQATLQHGSILLAVSSAAPELPGISDLLGRTISREALIEAWLKELAAPLAAEFVPQELTADEHRRAQWWRSEQFSASKWVGKR